MNSESITILVLHGPNLQLLGTREPEVYGATTLDEINDLLRERAGTMGVELQVFQSNHEGDLVDRIGQCRGQVDGLIFNPAAYTHTSVALRDALQAADVPCVEVHLSNPAARETFRHRSYTLAACIGQVSGFGPKSYCLALDGLVEYLKSQP